MLRLARRAFLRGGPGCLVANRQRSAGPTFVCKVDFWSLSLSLALGFLGLGGGGGGGGWRALSSMICEDSALQGLRDLRLKCQGLGERCVGATCCRLLQPPCTRGSLPQREAVQRPRSPAVVCSSIIC